ncbi:FlgD immunoglobulin-like domain containing protein, partial [candidate division KSB1 bacterium]
TVLNSAAFCLVLLIIFQNPGVFAQDIPQAGDKPIRICWTPQLTDDNIKYAQKRTADLYPDLLKEGLSQPGWLQKGMTPQVGDSLQFWAYNVKDDIFEKVWTQLQAIGTEVYIWVEIDQINNGTVNDSYVISLLDALENSTPQGSYDPSKGIIKIENEIFGFEPNIDGDGFTDVVLLDIQDYFEMQTNPNYISGFFHPNDQTNSNFSNEKDIIYLDTYPGVQQNSLLLTAAHEYQHLIHYTYDPDEENLINEGASQLAQPLTGQDWDDPSDFFSNTDRGLFYWGEITDPNILADYYKAQMWMTYLWDQFGKDFMTSLIQDPQTGRSSLTNRIAQTGTGLTFSDVLNNWFIANYINDTSIDPAYGYTLTQALSYRAVPLITESNYPAVRNDESLKSYAAEYVKFKSFNSVIDLNGTFSSNFASAFALYFDENGLNKHDIISGSQFTDPDFGITHNDVVMVSKNESNIDTYYSYSFNALQQSSVVEVKYDDGSPDIISGYQDGIWWGTESPGFGWAVKFSPLSEESTLLGAKAYVIMDTVILGSPNFLFRVYDDQGISGLPGNDIIPPQEVRLKHSVNYYWWEIDLTEFNDLLSQYHDDYYISLEHPPNDTNAVFIGVDNTNPAESHSYALRGPGTTQYNPGWYPMTEMNLSTGSSLAPYDLMFRTLVSYRDTTPPVFTAGYLQNPVFSENFDFYVVGEKELNLNRLTGKLTVGTEEMDLEFTSSGNTGRVFVDNEVTLTSNGTVSMYINGTNLYGTIVKDTTIQFSVLGVSPGTNSKISTPDNRVTLFIPGNSLNRRTVFTAKSGFAVFPEGIPEIHSDGDSKPIGEPVTFGPEGLNINGFTVIFNYNPDGLESEMEDGLYIAKFENGFWIPAPSNIDEEMHTVSASVKRLGTYQLRWSDDINIQVPLRYELEQNYPNPFNLSTVIKFSIKNSEHVSLKIYNALGSEIRSLQSGFLPSGQHISVWDGRNNNGWEVPSGIYYYRIISGEFSYARKMVIVK